MYRNRNHRYWARNSKTVVRGIRATEEFWELADKVAAAADMPRNELIVRVVMEYCEKSGLDKE